MTDITEDLVERIAEEKQRFKIISEEYKAQTIEHARAISEIEEEIRKRMEASNPFVVGDFVRFNYRFNENRKTQNASNLRLGLGVVVSTFLHKRFDFTIQRDVYHPAVVVNLLRVSDGEMSRGIVHPMGIEYHGVVKISKEEFLRSQQDIIEGMKSC